MASAYVAAPRTAGAYDLETAFALASLIQLRAAVAETDSLLTSGELKERGPTSTVEGLRAYAGADVRARVKKLLRQYQPRDQGTAASMAAFKAGLISRKQAYEAERHAREAAERLATVIEFDAFDDMRADYSSKLAAIDTDEKRVFVHRALVSAQEELDAAFSSFGEAERAEAKRFSGGAYVPPDPVGGSGGLLFPGMPGYVYGAATLKAKQSDL